MKLRRLLPVLQGDRLWWFTIATISGCLNPVLICILEGVNILYQNQTLPSSKETRLGKLGKITVMEIVISLIILFVGISILVVIHVFIVGRVFIGKMVQHQHREEGATILSILVVQLQSHLPSAMYRLMDSPHTHLSHLQNMGSSSLRLNVQKTQHKTQAVEPRESTIVHAGSHHHEDIIEPRPQSKDKRKVFFTSCDAATIPRKRKKNPSLQAEVDLRGAQQESSDLAGLCFI
ncbi:hypothetical protein V8G54_036233 [Vigna mungo]|uniref:Uncharacterized protein n=1 Tax=Vigna mungo TaxID=3915 RepID=A0AAQ3MI20_VIGMU